MARNLEVQLTRTQIEVIGVDHGIGDIHEEGIVRVIIPSWNPIREIPVPVTKFERSLIDKLGYGVELTADVNLDADIPEDLFMKNFEKAPLPISESELRP